MAKIVDDMFDLLLLLIWLAIGATFLAKSMTELKTTLSYEIEDKTLIENANGNLKQKRVYNREEVLLMYRIADENQPYPCNLRVDNMDQWVKFNSSYFKERDTYIQALWNKHINSMTNNNMSFKLAPSSTEGGTCIWLLE